MSSGERYCLRLLLTVIPGAASYDELRRYEGEIYPTFPAACIARGLAEDDAEWEKVFEEAQLWQSHGQIQSSFVMGLHVEVIADPLRIWEKFSRHVFGDRGLRREQDRKRIYYPRDLEHLEQNYALYLIRVQLTDSNPELTLERVKFPHCQQTQNNWANVVPPRDQTYDPAEQSVKAAEKIPTLNDDQRFAFDTVTQHIADGPTNAHFYLQGPWGSGKIFLCVASMGIAAVLLPGGKTSHSSFNIPLELTP